MNFVYGKNYIFGILLILGSGLRLQAAEDKASEAAKDVSANDCISSHFMQYFNDLLEANSEVDICAPSETLPKDFECSALYTVEKHYGQGKEATQLCHTFDFGSAQPAAHIAYLRKIEMDMVISRIQRREFPHGSWYRDHDNNNTIDLKKPATASEIFVALTSQMSKWMDRFAMSSGQVSEGVAGVNILHTCFVHAKHKKKALSVVTARAHALWENPSIDCAFKKVLQLYGGKQNQYHQIITSALTGVQQQPAAEVPAAAVQMPAQQQAFGAPAAAVQFVQASAAPAQK